MGDSLLACLMMICSNGPSLHQRRRRWTIFFLLSLRDSRLSKRKCRPGLLQENDPGASSSASKTKSSVLSQLSGLENVLFNDFIEDELDSEDVSELSASASCICVRENLYLHFLNFVWVCACNCTATGKAHRTQVREWMGGWSDQDL